jgi:hypothetical protein
MWRVGRRVRHPSERFILKIFFHKSLNTRIFLYRLLTNTNEEKNMPYLLIMYKRRAEHIEELVTFWKKLQEEKSHLMPDQTEEELRARLSLEFHLSSFYCIPEEKRNNPEALVDEAKWQVAHDYNGKDMYITRVVLVKSFFDEFIRDAETILQVTA